MGTGLSKHTAKVIELSGSEYWIRVKEAYRLVKDRLATIISQRPLVIKELPHIRKTHRARYLENKTSYANRLYKSELIDSIRFASHGKRSGTDVFNQDSDGYVRLPTGFGKEK